MLLLAEQKFGLINSINGAVGGNFRSGYSGEGREEIQYVEHLLRLPIVFYFARPAHHADGAEGPFQCGEVVAAPESGRAMVTFDLLGSIVAGPNDDGVVADAELVNLIYDSACVSIDLREYIRVVAFACDSLEVRVRERWQVRLGEGDESEKRFVRLGLSLDEFYCPVGYDTID